MIWRTPLPPAVELYDLAEDPAETKNVAGRHPQTVAALQARVTELAGGMAKPLLLETELQALFERLAMPPLFSAGKD